MRVLVLGSGGREHALAWALRRSPECEELVCAPGSDGIARDARVAAVDLDDAGSVVALARRERSDLVVVGPEQPLVAGLADRLRGAGLLVFGPGREAARLEGSKVFAKEFMLRHRIPTAPHHVFDDADAASRHAAARAGPCVVKADGLAAGKGVAVCADAAAARAAIDEIMRARRFGAAGARVVIEERLSGEEVSFYAISDGERFATLGAAQDHKRVCDGDRGENTGGMGSYSPTPFLEPALERRVVERVVRPVFEGLRAEGHSYRGVLYAGLMVCDGEPHVIEFNVRFGDPETQAMLPRLESDLLPLLAGAASGRLPEGALRLGAAGVCVVMASKGYPREFQTGVAIDGIAEAEALPDVRLFHAGTRLENGRWRTAGGRVLGVSARGPTLAAARARAYEAVEAIHFEGAHWRSDVAARALPSA